ncbi:MAG TPA: radical SAM protein [Dehalococcoidia bacterium]|nr:radical SAM protein [Dehalococcoidia bacterium]
MYVKERRWLKRKVANNGEIVYDTVTRNIYRNGEESEIYADEDIFDLSTFDSRAPLKVYFDFTYLCNLECRHCITNSSPNVDRHNELSSERIASIMNELATIGVLEIGVGGGEPLCHQGIYPLLTHAKAVGLNVILTTNGILVTEKIARKLKDIDVSEVRVSFDGSEKVHNNIRGVGSYYKSLKALIVLLEEDIKAVPRITICDDEREGLEELFIDLAAVGANTIKAGLVFPRGRATVKENEHLFKYKRDNGMAMDLLEMAKKHGLNLKLTGDMALNSSTADGGDLRLGKRKSCGAGFETGYIAPNGNVQPCSGMPSRVFGNMRKDSFITSWAGQKAKKWRDFTSTHDSWFLCGNSDSYDR